jgi:tRNA acetyltransferase TAN1
MPDGHTVSLGDPDIFVLVEVFKVCRSRLSQVFIHNFAEQSVCGISVVQEYYRLQKFNVMEIAKSKQLAREPEDSRIPI